MALPVIVSGGVPVFVHVVQHLKQEKPSPELIEPILAVQKQMDVCVRRVLFQDSSPLETLIWRQVGGVRAAGAEAVEPIEENPKQFPRLLGVAIRAGGCSLQGG
jgi:hypothetical protein